MTPVSIVLQSSYNMFIVCLLPVFKHLPGFETIFMSSVRNTVIFSPDVICAIFDILLVALL